MSDNLPPCPECSYEYTYEMGDLLVCSACAHEWAPGDGEPATAAVIHDSVGNPLADGDTVTVVKSLKLKGSASLKAGTKVRNIRLLSEPVDGHDIDCKIDGIGALRLKSSVVKKS